jgi:hypothetical protein
VAFLNLVSRLCGELPGLSPLLAQSYINDALGQIYNERLWSFNVLDGAINCPAAVIAGSVAITQYSDQVTLDATASAAVLPQTLVGATPGILNTQIRFAPSTAATASQIYNIVAFDDTNPAALVLTLNRVVQEATNAAAAYQFYRCYVIQPMTDFLKWESFNDFANAIALLDPRMTYTSAYFDARDPQRQSQGIAYYLGHYAGGFQELPPSGDVRPLNTISAGQNVWELWPHPTQGQNFYVRFRRSGALFNLPTDTQPAALSDVLILARAKADYVYPFAAANVGSFPTFKGVNWTLLIATAQKQYTDNLVDAKRIDDEQALQTVWARGHGLRQPRGGFKDSGQFPIDSNYLQSHLVRF